MQIVKSSAQPVHIHGSWSIGRFRISKRAAMPIGLVLLAIAGILSPLFDLSQVHGIPSAKLYAQHLYFDGIGDAGGYYSATFCKHWYHRVPIAIGFGLATTFALITLVG